MIDKQIHITINPLYASAHFSGQMCKETQSELRSKLRHILFSKENLDIVWEIRYNLIESISE